MHSILTEWLEKGLRPTQYKWKVRPLSDSDAIFTFFLKVLTWLNNQIYIYIGETSRIWTTKVKRTTWISRLLVIGEQFRASEMIRMMFLDIIWKEGGRKLIFRQLSPKMWNKSFKRKIWILKILELNFKSALKNLFQQNFTCSKLRKGWSFRSEGPKSTKTTFQHVYLKVEITWLNIWILEYGPPDILKYGPPIFWTKAPKDVFSATHFHRTPTNAPKVAFQSPWPNRGPDSSGGPYFKSGPFYPKSEIWTTSSVKWTSPFYLKKGWSILHKVFGNIKMSPKYGPPWFLLNYYELLSFEHVGMLAIIYW